MPHVKWLIPSTCVVCGRGFIATVVDRKKVPVHCSYDCRLADFLKPDRSGRNSASWKGGMPKWTCSNCGESFVAYHRKNGMDRKFCSWKCSNVAHRFGANEMRARLKYENELMEKLTAEGYQCLRSAGSRGPVDVFAFNAQWTRLIQVKSTKNFDRKGNVSMFVTAIEELNKVPLPANITKELWVRVLRSGWRYIVTNDAPAERTSIKKFVASASWIFPWRDYARTPDVREL